MTTINAKDGHDLGALIQVRKALESGAAEVRVAFPGARVYRAPVTFKQSDLPAIRQKLIFSM